MALRLVTYLGDIEFSQLNHGETYNIIKTASSYEDCFANAMAYGADIIMRITNPVYRVQDLFLSFENYEDLPTVLVFYVYAEDTVFFAVSNCGRRREELCSLFYQFFSDQFPFIYNFSSEYTQISARTEGTVQPRILQLEKSEFLTDLLRGGDRREIAAYRRTAELRLAEGGYYLYVWFLRDAKGLDYSHHRQLKDVYNFIGALLQRECQEVLDAHRGGEVFYSDPRRLCALINAPASQEEVRQIAGGLTYAMGTADAARYMSGHFKGVEGAREAFESINELRRYNFFCRDAELITARLIQSLTRPPKPGQVNQLLAQIQRLITYETGSPDLPELVQQLFLRVVKPSMDYDLFFYCMSNVNSFLYEKLTERFQAPAPIRIPRTVNLQHSNIEIECGNLLTAIQHLQTNAQTGVATVKNPLVAKAVKYIQKNYAEDISLLTLAQHLNISSVYLSQLFKKELGTSPIKFIIHYRIDRAKVLLKETDDSISNIAVKVGFWEPKHFSKTFKRVTGISPMQYKKSQ